MVLAITNKASLNMHSFLKKYHLCAYIKRENGNELVNSLKASSCSDSNFLNHWSFPHNISSVPERVAIF